MLASLSSSPNSQLVSGRFSFITFTTNQTLQRIF
ncbi:hypothetical protein LINPERPRIM_LOCUS30330 [Linum perenne]